MTQLARSVHHEIENELSDLLLSQAELSHVSRLVTVGELSACFAHEVFNPLMMIRGHLRFAEELLAESDPMRSHLEVIDRASRRIEDMARRMLDFSRKRTPHLGICSLSEALQDAIRFVSPYLRSHTVEIELDIEPGLPELPLDRWQMVQAFVNLMQNAADAMALSSRRVIGVSVHRDGDDLVVSFADTGDGIMPADLNRIFSPFFTTKGEHGTGLGLYITRRVVEDHRGTISVHSGSEGTTFTVNLPLK